ncbi:type II toxin-antitoxin system PemK/MazF family toxin [Marivirga sp.]|uniref:type II toxin-antitoxin system PemK/MazF family toxin n=1 Tax=Marivirga sp. TaxID=2018662 RepID=UPI002D7EDE5C|nr:type II toxin-antitoxin system PemK/MazF family toxin [Marivirga sp.]HET8861511.1 type II toxin-antitoxin system PemK/MazF family toxin [Marivirga sp.]
MTSIINSLGRYDVVVIRFPFSSQTETKARPAIIISGDLFNNSKREDLIVLAISSSIKNKLEFEPEIINWELAGLLKPSILKSAIATIEQKTVIEKLGRLDSKDQNILDAFLNIILT